MGSRWSIIRHHCSEGRRLTDRYTHAMRADGRASDITLRHNNAAGGQHGFNRHKTDADDIVQALGVTGRRTTHTTNSAVPTWSVVGLKPLTDIVHHRKKVRGTTEERLYAGSPTARTLTRRHHLARPATRNSFGADFSHHTLKCLSPNLSYK